MGDPSADWTPRIRAVTFDFWGTLYSNEPLPAEGERTSLRIKNIGSHLSRSPHHLNVDAVNEAFLNSYEMFRDLQTQEETMRAKDMILAMGDELGVEFGVDEIEEMTNMIERAAIDIPPSMTPGAAKTIATLSKRFRLAVIAGTGLTPGSVLREILAKDSLAKHFECFSFSDEALHGTVHSDQFLQVLTELDVRPEEAVHVGDLLEGDIKEARAVGMHTILYTPTVGFFQGEYEADALVEDLSEIPQAIKGLSARKHVYGAY